MKKQIKLLVLSAICGVMSAQFAAAGGMISFSNVVDSAYGTIDYVAGANGNIDMGANGAIAYGPGYSGTGVGVPGRFQIGGGFFNRVDISCNPTAVMTNSAGSALLISEVEVSSVFGTGPFGTGATCNGIGNTVLSITLFFGVYNTVLIGTRIDGTGGIPVGPGYYATDNPGGTSMLFDVVYQ